MSQRTGALGEYIADQEETRHRLCKALGLSWVLTKVAPSRIAPLIPEVTVDAEVLDAVLDKLDEVEGELRARLAKIEERVATLEAKEDDRADRELQQRWIDMGDDL